MDDESGEVRSEILNQLAGYGPSLEYDLQEYNGVLDSKKMELLNPIINSNRQTWLAKTWSSWMMLDDPYDQIETALNLISKFHYGIYFNPELPYLLDELTEEFKNRIPYGDELDLSHFLFQEKGIKGARDDYYNPFNSNAIYTLKEKKGLPITLCLIYILIGNRLGLNINACNFPGHFLARIDSAEETLYIDCYNGGKILYESDIQNLAGDSYESLFDIIKSEIDPYIIIRRILTNLINSYSVLNDAGVNALFQELLDRTHP